MSAGSARVSGLRRRYIERVGNGDRRSRENVHFGVQELLVGDGSSFKCHPRRRHVVKGESSVGEIVSNCRVFNDVQQTYDLKTSIDIRIFAVLSPNASCRKKCLISG